ncbi:MULTISPECIES: hypothetical protein [unclassified Mycobacterium]|uniref:hypothetical protein n=1 Tax=unclassified Mycobacterium TaxID=2642494 RepID=UPI0029C87FAE|nr:MULTISPECIES: hypothetical protein [unclassified Mycobacterium]
MPEVCLRGIELRYALVLYLGQHGPHTVAELIDALTHQGFSFAGRPSKAISDALRWEVARGRVRHLERGLYGPGPVPRSTEYRIHQRVIALRERARGEPLPLGRWDDADWHHT